MLHKDRVSASWFPHGSFVELTMYKYGYNKCAPLHHCGPWHWDSFVFHYVISGKGVVHSTDDSGDIHEYVIEPGQGFVFWPGQVNSYTADKDDPWEYYWIEFGGIRAQDVITQAGLTYNNPIYTTDNTTEKDVMVRELVKIVENDKRPPMELIGCLYGFLSGLVGSSSCRNIADNNKMPDFYVKKALDYIEQHYTRELTIQEIADYCEVHRSYLHRIFISCLDSSPKQFLDKYRVRKAVDLMLTTGYSIGEIRELVGCSSQASFNKVFKRIMECTPQDMKREISRTLRAVRK